MVNRKTTSFTNSSTKVSSAQLLYESASAPWSNQWVFPSALSFKYLIYREHIFSNQEYNISILSFAWNHLTATALFVHTAFYSLEVTFSLWLHWTYRIPISLGVLMLQISHKSSALEAILCRFETQARPSHHWAFSHDSQKCTKWRSYKARSLLSFYAYSREERNGHPVPPRHFYHQVRAIFRCNSQLNQGNLYCCFSY